MNKIEEVVELITKPIIEELGYELVEVNYTTNKTSGNTLTLFIHKEEGITLEDCEKVSKAVDNVLDEQNPTQDQPYTFNVSSLGLDRPMKTNRDFERQLNKQIEVKLFAPQMGKKNFTGKLVGFDDNTITIESKKNKITTTTRLERTQIAKATLVIQF